MCRIKSIHVVNNFVYEQLYSAFNSCTVSLYITFNVTAGIKFKYSVATIPSTTRFNEHQGRKTFWIMPIETLGSTHVRLCQKNLIKSRHTPVSDYANQISEILGSHPHQIMPK